jgi:predicted dinucleotide-utilizing enzyme
MATQLGTTLDIGSGTITGSYIVESVDEKDFDVDFEDIMDEDGARVTRLIFNRDEKITLNLICIDAAAPQTDFVVGTIATHTDFTTYYVDSATMTKSKSARRVTVNMTNIGIT